jgi:hypothetical protein
VADLLRHPELGRELTAKELCERTVVIVGREDSDTMYTAWVYRIGVDYVAFKAGVIATVFIANRAPDDKLTDETGKKILVFEYLGEI